MYASPAKLSWTPSRKQNYRVGQAVNYGSATTLHVSGAWTSLMAGITIKAASAEWFRAWADKWKRDTGHLSSQSSRRNHPAYRQIVGLGEVAIPLLLKELRDRPDFWFSALREVTGEDPIQDHIRGNFDQMRAAWLNWANQKSLAIDDGGQAIPQQGAA